MNKRTRWAAPRCPMGRTVRRAMVIAASAAFCFGLAVPAAHANDGGYIVQCTYAPVGPEVCVIIPLPR